MTYDCIVLNMSGLFVFRPITEDATDWIEANCHLETWQRVGIKDFVVDDRRLAVSIAQGMLDDGLQVA